MYTMTKSENELKFLREEVAAKFGGRLETTTDYDALSDAIEVSTHERVSTSTLKRLWGYVSLSPRPRTATLDLLSQYVGREDFRALTRELAETSSFLSEDRLDSSSLAPGVKVRLSWLPDRVVTLSYLGDKRFRVLDSGTSKLREGDEFEAGAILQGHPLYLDTITREGKQLPSYVAGRSAGLTSIEIL